VQFLKNECQENLLQNDTQSEIEIMKEITKRSFIISNSSKLIRIRLTENINCSCETKLNVENQFEQMNDFKFVFKNYSLDNHFFIM
jgi:hypothetical protein